MTRELFKAIIVPSGSRSPGLHVLARELDRLKTVVRAAGLDPEYYLLTDSVEDIAYRSYLANLERGKMADEEEI